MQSDLGALCKAARERISVPEIPLARIQEAAECCPAPRSGKRWTGTTAAVLVSASIATAAAGAAVWSQTHVSLHLGSIQLSAERLASTKSPSIQDLRAAARHADFPVILPAGLPEGTTLVTLMRFGSSALLLQYNLPGAWRRSDHVLVVVLANPKTLAASQKQSARKAYELRLRDRPLHGNVDWIICHEEFIMLGSTLTPAELARIKSATIAQSLRPNTMH